MPPLSFSLLLATVTTFAAFGLLGLHTRIARARLRVGNATLFVMTAIEFLRR